MIGQPEEISEENFNLIGHETSKLILALLGAAFQTKHNRGKKKRKKREEKMYAFKLLIY